MVVVEAKHMQMRGADARRLEAELNITTSDFTGHGSSHAKIARKVFGFDKGDASAKLSMATKNNLSQYDSVSQTFCHNTLHFVQFVVAFHDGVAFFSSLAMAGSCKADSMCFNSSQTMAYLKFIINAGTSS